jgi:predicted DNA-binding WGR domain protein
MSFCERQRKVRGMKRPMYQETRSLELRQVDPMRHRARRYHIAECRSLFGEHGLLITWGRIGGPARVRLETFTSEDELDGRWQELIARRSAHGYRIQASAA